MELVIKSTKSLRTPHFVRSKGPPPPPPSVRPSPIRHIAPSATSKPPKRRPRPKYSKKGVGPKMHKLHPTPSPSPSPSPQHQPSTVNVSTSTVPPRSTSLRHQSTLSPADCLYPESPHILVDHMIPLDANGQIIDYLPNDGEVVIDKSYLIRDAALSAIYWLCFAVGLFEVYQPRTSSLWYFRWIALFLLLCTAICSVLCHYYLERSPPLYPLYRGSDCVYRPDLNRSATEYIRSWNERQYVESEGAFHDPPSGDLHKQRSLAVKLYFLQLFGLKQMSSCGYIEITAKRIEDRSSRRILEDIERDDIKCGGLCRMNRLVRLRVFHILRFRDEDSHRKFADILKDTMQRTHAEERMSAMFHLEYNQNDIEERLLMKVSSHSTSRYHPCSLWSECCSNRRMSYFWYCFGCGFLYRCYHDLCVDTKIYHCVKEVTL